MMVAFQTFSPEIIVRRVAGTSAVVGTAVIPITPTRGDFAMDVS